MLRTLVMVPTYNESKNIEALLVAVFALPFSFDVLVIDDNSPDGTGQLVAELINSKRPHFSERIHLLKRPGKQGLGKAYVAGMRWGIEKNYQALVEMDADFSHRPVDLPKILEALESHDAVIGSRWVGGGGSENWAFYRKLISLGGSLYSRWVLGFPLRDWTGGFNGWRVEVFQKVLLDQLVSEGYSFQIELKYKTLRSGFRVCEVPILFAERRAGQSKMSLRIFLEAFFKIWAIRKAYSVSGGVSQ